MATVTITLKDDHQTGRVHFSMFCAEGPALHEFASAMKRAAQRKPPLKRSSLTRAQHAAIAAMLGVEDYKATLKTPSPAKGIA